LWPAGAEVTAAVTTSAPYVLDRYDLLLQVAEGDMAVLGSLGSSESTGSTRLLR
jgi:hypothetical protein